MDLERRSVREASNAIIVAGGERRQEFPGRFLIALPGSVSVEE